MSVLEVRSLSKAFGGVRAVSEVGFKVAQGEFLAMIGPNGAGKTTCFNIINGQLPSDSGEILFEGKNIAGIRWKLPIDYIETGGFAGAVRPDHGEEFALSDLEADFADRAHAAEGFRQ